VDVHDFAAHLLAAVFDPLQHAAGGGHVDNALITGCYFDGTCGFGPLGGKDAVQKTVNGVKVPLLTYPQRARRAVGRHSS
jgi:hypothetical protein